MCTPEGARVAVAGSVLCVQITYILLLQQQQCRRASGCDWFALLDYVEDVRRWGGRGWEDVRGSVCAWAAESLPAQVTSYVPIYVTPVLLDSSTVA